MSIDETFFFGKLPGYMKNTVQTIRKKLRSLQDTEYQKFSSALLPGVDNVLGVRLPVLRKLAKELAKDKCCILPDCEDVYMEETMLRGMLIGLMKDDPRVILSYVNKFLPKINNWSICDSFCCGLKFTKDNMELVWEFIVPLISSKEEYKVRFAIVMMLDYYINENYIDKILQLIKNVRHEGYYAKMAAAWALSMCYIKFPEKVYLLLKNSNLDSEIKAKSIRKICESYKVSKTNKQRVRGLK